MASHSRGMNTPALATTFWLLAWFLMVSLAATSSAQEVYPDYPLPMDTRPTLVYEADVRYTFPDGLIELWMKALDRPDAELQRLVIDSISIAHLRGMRDLEDAKSRIIELAKTPEQRLDVLQSAARALVVMDARDQTDLLAALVQTHGNPLAEIVEPAFVQWQSPAMKQVWLKRIADQSSGQSMMTVAMEGLTAIKAKESIDSLKQIVTNGAAPMQLRVSASRAYGMIGSEEEIDFAESVMNLPTRPAALAPLLALAIVSENDDADCIALLQKLAEHSSSVVQSEALAHLFRVNTDLVDQRRKELVSSKDVNVRRWAARAMVASEKPDRMALLSTILDDVNPSLRKEVAKELVRLAENDSLRDAIIAATTEMHLRDDWRGCEQACVVLGKLDHEPSGSRMLELLDHPRGEVKVASAWGLYALRVEALLPAMLDHTERVYEGFQSKQLNALVPGLPLQIGILFSAFGDQGYSAAEPLMMNYVPKRPSLGDEARPGAAWALGMLHSGKPDSKLVELFIARVRDGASMDPETEIMRRGCILALGQMKAVDTLPSLRKFTAEGGLLGADCYWAIEQISGEKRPPIQEAIVEHHDWFLAPIAPDMDKPIPNLDRP